MSTKKLRHGSCTIIMRRPDLTRTEKAKREQAVQETMEKVMRDYLNRKNQK